MTAGWWWKRAAGRAGAIALGLCLAATGVQASSDPAVDPADADPTATVEAALPSMPEAGAAHPTIPKAERSPMPGADLSPMPEYAVAWLISTRPAPADPVVGPSSVETPADVPAALAMAMPVEPVPALSYDASGLPRITGFQTNAPTPIVDLVEKLAPVYQLSPELVLAFMQAESGFNPNAQSPRNAKGLMQLIPGTAERFNVRNPFDPKQNIRGGMAYLRWLLAYFEGDLTLVAAGYNAGERRVDRYLGVPPYGETRAYVKRVVEALGVDSHPYDASITEPSARLEQIRASRARN